MTKVIIAGAAGRMGRRIGYMVNEHPSLQIAAGFEREDSPDLGKDMGDLGGYGPTGIKVAGGLDTVMDEGDVIIDFTFHEATMQIARRAAEKNRAMVIGTTGLSPENLEELRQLTAHFPCVQAPNMAVGVNVLFKLAAKVAGILGNDYDMEIVEAHHRMKKDAPSGTAMKLGDSITICASGWTEFSSRGQCPRGSALIRRRSGSPFAPRTIRLNTRSSAA